MKFRALSVPQERDVSFPPGTQRPRPTHSGPNLSARGRENVRSERGLRVAGRWRSVQRRDVELGAWMSDIAVAANFVLFCALPLGVIYGLLRWYQHWLSLPRASDISQIKAKLESNGRRVIDVQPLDFQRGSLGRFGDHLSFRKYQITVRSPVGGPDQVHVVGVQAGLLAMRGVKEYGRRGELGRSA